MNNKFYILFCLIFCPSLFYGQGQICTVNSKYNFELSAEYFLPVSNFRNIHSQFVTVLVGKNFVDELGGHNSLNFGILSASALGNITENYGNPEPQKMNASAQGIGPVMLIRCEFFEYEKLIVSGDVLGGIAFFNGKFPPQSGVYDFILKMGLSLGYHFNKNLTVYFSSRLMHISNGQGYGPQNPSYDGYGFSTSIIKHF